MGLGVRKKLKRQQFRRINFQRFGDFVERSYSRIALTALNHADISPIHGHPKRQFFLRYAFAFPGLLQFSSELLKNVLV